VKDCRRRLACLTVALSIGLVGWSGTVAAHAEEAQATAACEGASSPCVLNSSEQLSLSPGQTISRTLACPDATPTMYNSAYTTSNPSVFVTQASTDGGQGATFTALNRSTTLSFVTFHAGCVP